MSQPSPHRRKYRLTAPAAAYAATGAVAILRLERDRPELPDLPLGGDNVNAGPPGVYTLTGASVELVWTAYTPPVYGNVNAGPPGQYALVGAVSRSMRVYGPVPVGGYSMDGAACQLTRGKPATITNVNAGPAGAYALLGAPSLAIAE